MSERDYAPLSGACVRGLCDKIYDKRKFAGAEIEKMVKDFNDANNSSQIKKLLRVLGQDLMSSTYPNVKNGALMGLSSVAVGLGKDSVAYLPELIQPIIACFSEAESRVRYQATEALFNVVKIARGVILTHIPQVFGALARLAADPEPQVKQAAELLDRLLKDIVTDSPAFELAAFVPIVRERMYTRNAFARQFVLSWVAVLDAGPQLDLARHLPELLDGMFHMLADNMPEIRKMCEIQLNEFLRGIKKDPENVEFEAMINILITHAQSSDELVQLTALLWMREFVSLSGRGMSAHASGVLTATLPCLAHHHDARRNIRETAAAVNMQLMRLIENEGGEGKEKDGEGEGKAEGEDKEVGEQKEGRVDVPALVEVLTALLQHNSVHTKVAALDWILHLYNKLPAQMSLETERIFPRAVAALTDGADDVVRRALAVLAEICSCHHQPGDLESSPYYYKLLRALLRLLAADEALLEDRGAFIIRQLCVLLSAEDVYSALASILVKERDVRFVSTVVHVLSTLLLTAAELYHLRLRLRRLRRDDDISNASTVRLFTSLYRCWCHSPVSLVALCLLTHNYQHCNQLLTLFGDLEITVDLLTEIDQLVQLIESPIFAYMRLELLSGGGSLRSALYALLMLLPQSDAFHALRRRLQCAPTHAVTAQSSTEDQSDLDIDFSELLEEFKRVQDAHRQHRMLERSLHTAS